MMIENSVVDFSDLEGRLRPNRRGALKKISERITAIERLRPGLIIVGVIGAFIAALGKAVEGTPGIVMAVVGAALALFGGAFVALIDYRKLELGTYLTEAEAIAEDAIARGRGLERERDEVRADARTARH